MHIGVSQLLCRATLLSSTFACVASDGTGGKITYLASWLYGVIDSVVVRDGSNSEARKRSPAKVCALPEAIEQE